MSLMEIEDMDEEKAGQLIMTARAPWFEESQQGARINRSNHSMAEVTVKQLADVVGVPVWSDCCSR